MTPELYQCQYEKATKCAMDLPCLGCETHAKYATVEEKTDPLKPLLVTVETLEIRQELTFYSVGPILPIPERGRTLIKATAKFPFEVNAYAVHVNGVWYEKSLNPFIHNELWEKLKK